MSWEKRFRVEVEKIGLSYIKAVNYAVIINCTENMHTIESIRFAGKKLITPSEESRKVQQW